VPKIVDHETRRQELAGAVWRVIRRDGLDGASVRAVAREAGWSPSALRHYFPSQSELLAAAIGEVTARVDARMGDFRTRASADVESVLHELLPLDDERRAENEVWLAFSARAMVDPDLRTLHREVDAALHRVCEWAVAEITEISGKATKDFNGSVEADRLHALMDGLALHAALDAEYTEERLKKTLSEHLRSLTL
jgi:AcrR family transcriptional regulator